MDYRQLLLSQANALAAAGCYGSGGYSSSAAAAAAYSQNAARTYSYRLWTLANVLTDPCRRFENVTLLLLFFLSLTFHQSLTCLFFPSPSGFALSTHIIKNPLLMFCYCLISRAVNGPSGSRGRVLCQVLALQQRIPVTGRFA